MLDKIVFGLSWFRSPRKVGTLTPSSRSLGAAIARELNLADPGLVIELGAGTGALTEAMLKAGLPAENLIAIECDPVLANHLRKNFPGVTVLEGDATDLKTTLKDYDTSAVHTVVSGLPPLLMEREEQERLFGDVLDLVGPEGKMVQYTYSPKSPIPMDRLNDWGFEGKRRTFVLANLPPASVWLFTPTKNTEAMAA